MQEGCDIVEGTVDEEVYLEYLRDVLVPLLQPYTGDDSPPGSVLVLDNARHHWTNAAIELLESTGCLLVFLPAYSPDFNPIEFVFGLLISVACSG